MKQTAVEWLFDNLLFAPISRQDVRYNERKFNQAKEIEKEQIIEAGNSCALKQHLHSDKINKMTESELRQFAEEDVLTFGEEHYNETYNK